MVKNKNLKQYDTTFLAIMVTCAILIVIGMGSMFVRGAKSYTTSHAPAPTPVASSTPQRSVPTGEVVWGETVSYEQTGNPLQAHPNYTKNLPTVDKVTYDGAKIVIGDSTVRFGAKARYKPLGKACDFSTEEYNICPVGKGTVNYTTVNFFTISDIGENLWWKNSSNIQQVNLDGSPASIIGDSENSTNKFVLITLPDTSTGIAIMVENSTTQDIQTLFDSITIENQ